MWGQWRRARERGQCAPCLFLPSPSLFPLNDKSGASPSSLLSSSTMLTFLTTCRSSASHQQPNIVIVVVETLSFVSLSLLLSLLGQRAVVSSFSCLTTATMAVFSPGRQLEQQHLLCFNEGASFLAFLLVPFLPLEKLVDFVPLPLAVNSRDENG
jgi:hypothetical protein